MGTLNPPKSGTWEPLVAWLSMDASNHLPSMFTKGQVWEHGCSFWLVCLTKTEGPCLFSGSIIYQAHLFPKRTPTVDGRNPFRTTLKPVDTIVCWYLQGTRIRNQHFAGAISGVRARRRCWPTSMRSWTRGCMRRPRFGGWGKTRGGSSLFFPFF